MNIDDWLVKHNKNPVTPPKLRRSERSNLGHSEPTLAHKGVALVGQEALAEGETFLDPTVGTAPNFSPENFALGVII